MYMYLREAWSACGGPGDVAHYYHCLGATIATNGVLLPSASCSGEELARFLYAWLTTCLAHNGGRQL